MGLKDFQKPQYELSGMYRALVEDNVDPLDAGRVRVRVFSIHNFNGETTPVDQLPWAYPALGLYWSGGHNITNKDHESETPDPNENRYDPGKTARNSSQTEKNNKDGKQQKLKDSSTKESTDQDFKEEESDELANACGTGGQFVVPKRGNFVFVFFEGGNHMYPVYFAMAPLKRDWDTQKDHRNIEIEEKIKQIDGFRSEFEPRAKKEIGNNDESWANSAIINTKAEKPKLQIPIFDGENRDVCSITSQSGTTIAIDNRFGKEKFYIIHKNYIDHVDNIGNKKTYIGKSRNHSNDSNDPSNYEVGVEGNHELFIVGDYDIYTKGNILIQCDGNVQIDANKNIGILSRSGDIDIIVENGNINADVKGNLDVNVRQNANIKVKNDANVLIENDAKVTVNNNLDVVVKNNANVNVNNDANLTVGGNAKVLVSGDLDLTAQNIKISGEVNITGNVKISQNLDIGGNTSVGRVCYVTSGVDCGGFIRNKGPADLGSPLTAHQLIVTGGSGSGVGKSPQSPQAPQSPQTAQEANKTNGLNTDKSDLIN